MYLRSHRVIHKRVTYEATYEMPDLVKVKYYKAQARLGQRVESLKGYNEDALSLDLVFIGVGKDPDEDIDVQMRSSHGIFSLGWIQPYSLISYANTMEITKVHKSY